MSILFTSIATQLNYQCQLKSFGFDQDHLISLILGTLILRSSKNVLYFRFSKNALNNLSSAGIRQVGSSSNCSLKRGTIFDPVYLCRRVKEHNPFWNPSSPGDSSKMVLSASCICCIASRGVIATAQCRPTKRHSTFRTEFM